MGIIGVVFVLSSCIWMYTFGFSPNLYVNRGTSCLFSQLADSSGKPVLWDGELKGRSSVLVNRGEKIEQLKPNSARPRLIEKKLCAFDPNRECTKGVSTCHVDGRPCASSRGYLNKSFNVVRDRRQTQTSDNSHSEKSRPRNDKHHPPMNPPSMKYTTIPSRRHNAFDLEVKENQNPMDSYLVTKSNTIVLDFERMGKDWGTYILPNPTLGKNQAVNVVSNGFKVVQRVSSLIVESVMSFFFVFTDREYR